MSNNTVKPLIMYQAYPVIVNVYAAKLSESSD